MSTCNALARGVISFIEEKDWLNLIETIKFFADKFSKKIHIFLCENLTIKRVYVSHYNTIQNDKHNLQRHQTGL